MSSKSKLIIVLSALGLATLVLAPFQLVALRMNNPTALSVARRLPNLWHRLAARLIGLRVHCKGAPVGNGNLLLVSNHVSWLDIVALSCVAPVSFIAKQEVGAIPGASQLARLQRTVFITRENRREAGDQSSTISQRLVSGDRMVLFAEGTTGDGNRLLPFKSALFGAAQMALRNNDLEKVQVQPVAIRYTQRSGLPLGRIGRVSVAWPGDIELAPHFVQIVSGGPLDVTIRFGEPIAIDENTRRQKMARDAHSQIRQMLEQSLRG